LKNLGKCPYCKNGYIETREITTYGKKSKLYACSNAHWKRDEDLTVLSSDSTCSFRIFSNCLLKWNKAVLGENEIKRLLSNGEIEVVLHSRAFYKFENDKKTKFHTEYRKKIILNKEYGIEVIWD